MRLAALSPALLSWPLAAFLGFVTAVILLQSRAAGSFWAPPLLHRPAPHARAALLLPTPAGVTDTALLDAWFAGGGEVAALVFAGRREYLSLLWPHLERGRADGALSRVVFVANTADEADLRWLEKTRSAHSEFVSISHPPTVATVGVNNKDYCGIWAALPRSNATLWIKLDDDIVWLAPHALSALAAEKLRRPSALFLSANVVNHPLLAHVHARTGLYEQADIAAAATAAAGADADTSAFLQTFVTEAQAPVFDYCTLCGAWRQARLARLQHEMLLFRIGMLGVEGAVDAYASFARWDWDGVGLGAGGRWSINAFAFLGSDLERFDQGQCAQIDDEHYLSAEYGKVVGRHSFAMSGGALAAHFAFYPQREGDDGLDATDLLERYAALAPHH